MPWSGQIGSQLLDALGVVPHPVGVDDAGRRRCVGDAEHPAVHVRRDAGDHVRGGCPEPRRPVAADEVVVAADPAGRDDDRLCAAARSRRPPCATTGVAAGGGARLEDRTSHAGHRPAGHDELVDPVPEPQTSRRPGSTASRTRRSNGVDHAGPGAPGDVEPRDRVAVPGREVAAALGPADHGEQAHALRVQPGALLAGGEVDVRLGPFARPVVLRSRSNPAVPSQSCQARSWESLIPIRRCSGESTRNSPPNDQKAWPPRFVSGSWSTRITRVRRRRARRSRPARPARLRRR